MEYGKMTRLDMHVHCNSNNMNDLQFLAEQCRRMGTIICLSGGTRYGDHDYSTNEEVIGICKKFPDCFIPLAKLDLWESADPAEVRRYVEMGAKGFKCIYPYYEYDHDLYMPLYEEAEKCGTPILFHTGNFRPNGADIIYKRPMLRNMHPISLDRIARSFQKLKLVMAHMGTMTFQPEAAMIVRLHSNLYCDLAGSGSWGRFNSHDLYQMFKPAVQEVDVSMKQFRKIVLGSDAYVKSPQTMVMGSEYYERLMRRIGVPADVLADIMGRTAASWFGITLEE